MSAPMMVSMSESPNIQRAEDRFFVMMAITFIVLSISGFGPALVNTASRIAPLTIAVGAHAAIFSAWLLLFLAQSCLVATGRFGLHRRLGYAGVLLAATMVGTGFFTSISMAQRGYDLSGDLHAATDPLFVLVFQLGDLVVFGVLVIIALAYRCHTAVHKRLILFATIGGLMPASLSHIIGHSALLRDLGGPIILLPFTLLLSAGAIHDRIYGGRVHPVSLWAPAVLLTWSNLRAIVIGPSDAWHAFAAWLVS